jgi:dihydrofolate reductase
VARKVTFGAACSLDLFIARPDFSYDWILHNREAGEVMTDYWKGIDTILMGRKTWDVARSHGYDGVHPGMTTYVFSRTLPPSDKPGLSIVAEDVVPFVWRLKAAEGQGICMMGGGKLARPLFEAGLIDEVGLNVHPILLGSGVPMFHAMPRQINLERIDCRPFGNGCVYVLYAVREGRSAAKKPAARTKAKKTRTPKPNPKPKTKPKRRAAAR